MRLARRLSIPALLLSVALLSALWLGPAAADPPQSFTHQGRVIHNGNPYQGVMQVRFDFFSSSDPAASPVLSETQSIDFSDGFYTVELGKDTANFLAEFTADQPIELAVTIFPEDFKDGLTLTPRQQITSVPYAVVAQSVLGGEVRASSISVGDTTVIGGSGQWEGPPLSSSKLAEESVTSAKIRNGAVTSDKVADGSITAPKLAPNSVNSGTILDSSVSSADIQDNAVTSADIQNETIRQPDIQPGGGVYSYKRDVYTTRQAFTSTSGAVSTQEVACADLNDLPLSGACSAPQDSGARLQSTEALNWASESLPAAWRCAFFNDSAPVQVEASILCVRVPGP